MTAIIRNPETAANEDYDIIVVGGGIYGAMLLLVAAQQGQKVLLLEKGDFGSETSYNSLRIIHGGLRYLQTLDIKRFSESVAERRWFLRTFPDLVKPMPCLMPLYNKGVKRPAVLKAALTLNDLLSAKRNKEVRESHAIQRGKILSPSETIQIFPGVINNGLTGSALWYDAHMPDSQRVIMEILHWAVSLDAKAFNYAEVTDVLIDGNTVNGVQVTDHESGKSHEYHAKKVINATGPFSRQFSARYNRDIPELFRPSVAWNVLFNIPAPCSHALALTPDRPHAQTYFLHPWKGRLLAGTGHAPSKSRSGCDPAPDAESLDEFVDHMNLVMPDANLSIDHIERVYSGCLPVTEEGGIKLTKRAVIHDHASTGGPKGLYSISGNKFTTSRKEAERTLKYILGLSKLKTGNRPGSKTDTHITCIEYDWMPAEGDDSWKIELKKLISDESVVHIEDLIYRRTSIGDNSSRVLALADEIAGLFDWDEHRREQETRKLLDGLTIKNSA